MYIIPLDKPKFCNKCPFGICVASYPFWSEDKPLTKTYECNLEKLTKGKHIEDKITVGYDDNIKTPRWCQLKNTPFRDI